MRIEEKKSHWKLNHFPQFRWRRRKKLRTFRDFIIDKYRLVVYMKIHLKSILIENISAEPKMMDYAFEGNIFDFKCITTIKRYNINGALIFKVFKNIWCYEATAPFVIFVLLSLAFELHCSPSTSHSFDCYSYSLITMLMYTFFSSNNNNKTKRNDAKQHTHDKNMKKYSKIFRNSP